MKKQEKIYIYFEETKQSSKLDITVTHVKTVSQGIFE